MKGELKAGGLALVYGLRVRPEGNGKVVELIGLASPREQDYLALRTGLPPGVWWRVKGMTDDGAIAQVRPENLMPIDDSDPDAVDQRERDLVAG